MVAIPHDHTRLTRRDWTSSLGVSSPLYIFLGILITLCVAAPLLSYLRHNRLSNLASKSQSLRGALDSAREKTREIVTLRAARTGSENAANELRSQLRDENARVVSGQLQVESLEERERELEREMAELGVTMEGVDAARQRAEEEMEVVRGECERARERVGELEDRLAEKEEGLWDLRRKFGVVNQEYLKLLNGEGGGERGAAG